MKNRYFLLVVSILIITSGALFFFLKPTIMATNPWVNADVNTMYEVELHADPENLQVSGTMNVQALNDTGTDQSSILFHLYPNAFEETYHAEDEYWNKVLGSYSEPGNIEIHSIKINNKEVDYEIDQILLTIPLEWKQEEVAEIDMDFTINMPFNKSRMSYNGDAYWMGNSLPIRAFYDSESGWFKEPYYTFGEPFHSEMANYKVEINLPEQYDVASTGHKLTVEQMEGNTKSHQIDAKKVRDFSYVVTGEQIDFIESTVEDTTIRTWYSKRRNSKEDIMKYHKSAEESLHYFNKHYGKYPYNELDIVETGGYFGGMEYPGLVYVTEYNFSNEIGIQTVVHEIAHQWWYNIVGSNPVKHAWMDESLTSYVESQFMRKFYPDLYKESNQKEKDAVQKMNELHKADQHISSSLSQFTKPENYFTLIYGIGPQMFEHLEHEVGMEKMNQALAAYYEENKYSIASPEDLLSAFEKEISPASRLFLEQWLKGNKVTLQDVE